MYGPTSVADASFKVKNTFLEIAPVEEEAALRKRRSRSDGHDLKKSPLVVASKSPIASPLLQPVDETRQAMPIDDVDFEMLEDAAEVEGDSPTVAATRKRTASNGESVAQVAANMGNEPAYVVPTTPSPFLHSSFPPQVPDFGYGYGMEMGLPPAYDGEDQVDYNEVAAMNAGFMQGMQFLTPEMCSENFMQGMFMPPYWQQMGMDGQMPCMDGQAMMPPELQEQLQKAAQMQEEYQQEQLAQMEPPQQEEPAPAPQEPEKEEEKEASAAPVTNGESRRSSREDAKWKDWKESSWHDWQESSSKKDHDWREHDWKDHAWKDNDWKDDWRRGGDDGYWKEAADSGSRRGSKGKSKGNGKEQRGWEEDKGVKDAERSERAATSSRNKVPEESRQGAADPSMKEKKIPPIPYERPEGNEPYTTVMLRNIPNKYTREMLIKQLSLEFNGEFDFMYLPIDFKNKCNVGYGFINFRTQDSCERFIGLFHGVDVRKCLPGLNSKKVVEVTPARVQGLTENVRRLRNSPVMNQLQDHPEWMPLLFDENGVDQPFPLPDQPLPPVKPRGRNREGQRGSSKEGADGM